MKLFKKENEKEPEALTKYGKLRTAIREAARKLSPLIDDLLSARKDLATAEVSDVVGDEANPEAIALATSRVNEAETKLNDGAATLDRLRTGLAGLASEIWKQRCKVRESLPSHASALKQAFSIEWSAAVEKFQLALNKRASLEQTLGEQLLELAEPIPGLVSESAQLTIDQTPWRQFEALEAAISEILAPKRIAEEMRKYPPIPQAARFAPDEIYTLMRPVEGLDAGVRVIEKSLPANMLRLLFNVGDAIPFVAPTGDQDLAVAQQSENAQEAADRAAAGRPEPEPKEEISEERRRWLEWERYSGFEGQRVFSVFPKGARNV